MIGLCSNCGKKIKAPDSAAGKAVKCPQCGSRIRLPESADGGEGGTAAGAPPPPLRPASGSSGGTKPAKKVEDPFLYDPPEAPAAPKKPARSGGRRTGSSSASEGRSSEGKGRRSTSSEGTGRSSRGRASSSRRSSSSGAASSGETSSTGGRRSSSERTRRRSGSDRKRRRRTAAYDEVDIVDDFDDVEVVDDGGGFGGGDFDSYGSAAVDDPWGSPYTPAASPYAPPSASARTSTGSGNYFAQSFAQSEKGLCLTVGIISIVQSGLALLCGCCFGSVMMAGAAGMAGMASDPGAPSGLQAALGVGIVVIVITLLFFTAVYGGLMAGGIAAVNRKVWGCWAAMSVNGMTLFWNGYSLISGIVGAGSASTIPRQFQSQADSFLAGQVFGIIWALFCLALNGVVIGLSIKLISSGKRSSS